MTRRCGRSIMSSSSTLFFKFNSSFHQHRNKNNTIIVSIIQRQRWKQQQFGRLFFGSFVSRASTLSSSLTIWNRRFDTTTTYTTAAVSSLLLLLFTINTTIDNDNNHDHQEEYNSLNNEEQQALNMYTHFNIMTMTTSCQQQQQQQQHRQQPKKSDLLLNDDNEVEEEEEDNDNDLWLSPILPIRILQPNPHLEIAFCCRTRNPIYVMEKDLQELFFVDDDDDVEGKGKQRRNRRKRKRRRYNFFEESTIPKSMRSQLNHYKYSGWDRGHLAPSADFSTLGASATADQNNNNNNDDDNDIDIDYKQHTYNLCNVSPQHPQMNRIIWSKLEDWIRKMIIEEIKETNKNNNNSKRRIHVITGPIWLPKRQLHHHANNKNNDKFEYTFEGLGKPPSLVHVPTHFFKIVVVVSNDNCQIKKFACFVIANNDDDDDRRGGDTNKNKELHDYLVPWTHLEIVTGLQFFSKLIPNNEWKQFADQLTFEQQQQQQQLSSKEPLLLLGYDNSSSKNDDEDEEDVNTQGSSSSSSSWMSSLSTLFSNNNKPSNNENNEKKKKMKKRPKKGGGISKNLRYSLEHLCHGGKCKKRTLKE